METPRRWPMVRSSGGARGCLRSSHGRIEGMAVAEEGNQDSFGGPLGSPRVSRRWCQMEELRGQDHTALAAFLNKIKTKRIERYFHLPSTSLLRTMYYTFSRLMVTLAQLEQASALMVFLPVNKSTLFAQTARNL